MAINLRGSEGVTWEKLEGKGTAKGYNTARKEVSDIIF